MAQDTDKPNSEEREYCAVCGRELTSANMGGGAGGTGAVCIECQQRRYEELAAALTPSLAYFYCCLSFDTPFDMNGIPDEESKRLWMAYVDNLRIKALDTRDGERLGFLDGLTDITKIYGANLTAGEFSKAVSTERSARFRQPGTKAQRNDWGTGNEKKPYTDEDYKELDRIYDALTTDLMSAGGLSNKQEFIIRNCARWTLDMNKSAAAGKYDAAKKLSGLIQENLASEQLRKRDARPVDDFRLDSFTDTLEKAGLLKDGKWCDPDEMFQILFGRPPKYAYTKDAAEQMILMNFNRRLENDGMPTTQVLPDWMRLTDDLGEFAEEPGKREKEAYEKLGLMPMVPPGVVKTPYEWAMNLKEELTVEEWMREMESRYTGADEFPVISDESLTESQSLVCMERQHICKYQHATGDPKDFIYIVGYDLSYEAGVKNARCAAVVLKCTRQKAFLKRDRFLKQQVYIDDWPPPDNSMLQARKLKDIWYRFCYDGGAATYIAIDGWQYGKAVVEDLMTDLGDGLPPLCIRNHADYTNAELPGAIPIIYPIKAGGPGVTDPDFEMVKYAQIQFDNHNVELLTPNMRDGLEAYKRLHRIKDDYQDYMIAQPYQKSREQAGQIQNLKLKPSGSGMSEKRISDSIQRDSWSALKYALRLAQIIEREELVAAAQGKSDWESELKKYRDAPRRAIPATAIRGGRLVTQRRGGRFV